MSPDPSYSQVIKNDRRETVYGATNRILEYAGQNSEQAQREIEDAVDTILSTIGVPDRVVQE